MFRVRLGLTLAVYPLDRTGRGSNVDQKFKGNLEEAGGKVKEGAGRAIDDPQLESEGKMDQAKGDVRQGVGDVQQGIEDKLDRDR